LQGLTNSTLTAEVEKKLHDLFQEEQDKDVTQVLDERIEPEETGSTGKKETSKEESPLAPLKSIVLSLDWEITDEAMDDFLRETETLRSRCEEDQVLLTFVQILQALGKYIKRHKARTHPDAIRLLSTSFESLEKAFEDKTLSDVDRKALLDEKIREFMSLKQAIASERRGLGADARSALMDVETIKEAVKEAMKEVVEEIRAAIREELEKVRSEFNSLDEKQAVRGGWVNFSRTEKDDKPLPIKGN